MFLCFAQNKKYNCEETMKNKLLLMIVAVSMLFVACAKEEPTQTTTESTVEVTTESATTEATEAPVTEPTTDATATPSTDAKTSASLVPDDLVTPYTPNGFSDSDAKKALFVVGDPRKYSVNYDLIYTAMAHFESQGVEVELRDLYDIGFNPVVSVDEFYYAKDGNGTPSPEIKIEQDFVTQSDYIIFCYPNWHDTPTAIVKGYMERVFAKKFAYQDTADGLLGLLSGKSSYTIMNAGFLGGGRGYIGDGVGIDDTAWDRYMNAFKVMDDDTAGFWGTENKGRFVNDRTPKIGSETYAADLETLREALRTELNEVFFK